MLNPTNMKRSTRILYVDADACPVKEEIVDTCQQYSMEMVFVSSYAHRMTLPAPAKVVTVDSDKEAVDMYIMNKVKKGDLCITQDHALASILLSKGVITLSPRGMIYREETIDQMLDARYLSQKQRRMGAKTKGPKAFQKSDRLHFAKQLQNIIVSLQTEW
ncbi:YaiI/YqxD family protein [bacterium LRH843]|nr:YaiI/YqxD family protein [bacterium LRH843]